MITTSSVGHMAIALPNESSCKDGNILYLHCWVQNPLATCGQETVEMWLVKVRD